MNKKLENFAEIIDIAQKLKEDFEAIAEQAPYEFNHLTQAFNKFIRDMNDKSKSDLEIIQYNFSHDELNKVLKYLNNFSDVKTRKKCFDKINFQDKHYLHCGHVYHCLCINKWLDLGHDECPTCKQDIDCDKDSSDTISLDEDDENNYQININENNDNRLRNENRIIITRSNKKEILLIFIIYILLVTFFMLSFTIENKDIPITVF